MTILHRHSRSCYDDAGSGAGGVSLICGLIDGIDFDDQPLASADPIVAALRLARGRFERLRTIPDLIDEEEGRALIAALDSAEVLRHGELAEREMLAIPVTTRELMARPRPFRKGV